MPSWQDGTSVKVEDDIVLVSSIMLWSGQGRSGSLQMAPVLGVMNLSALGYTFSYATVSSNWRKIPH